MVVEDLKRKLERYEYYLQYRRKLRPNVTADWITKLKE